MLLPSHTFQPALYLGTWQPIEHHKLHPEGRWCTAWGQCSPSSTPSTQLRKEPHSSEQICPSPLFPPGSDDNDDEDDDDDDDDDSGGTGIDDDDGWKHVCVKLTRAEKIMQPISWWKSQLENVFGLGAEWEILIKIWAVWKSY